MNNPFKYFPTLESKERKGVSGGEMRYTVVCFYIEEISKTCLHVDRKDKKKNLLMLLIKICFCDILDK